MFNELDWYIEIKGTQKPIDQSDAREIFRSGTRRGLITCARITLGARAYIESIGAFYIEQVPLEAVMNYINLEELE